MDLLSGRAGLFATLLVTAAVSTAPAEPEIVAIEPGIRDSLLVCHLVTTGLPDVPSASTLSSGLPAALTIAFTLSTDEGSTIEESRVDVRIEPDLWEERFLLRTPFLDVPLDTLGELGEALSRLGPLPVARMATVAPGVAHRVRARLAVHPIAPAEVERVQSLFTEDPRTERREISVGLGSLVRFFLGKRSDERWISDVTSSPFTPAAIAKTEGN